MNITTRLQLDMGKVRQIIAEALSLPGELVIDADAPQDVSQLTRFVTVGILTSNRVGSESTFDAELETETITVSHITTLSISAYGHHAYALIEQLSSMIKTSAMQTKFKRLGVAILSCSAINNQPTNIETEFEQCTQVEINLSHIHRIKSHVNRIDSVSISSQKG